MKHFLANVDTAAEITDFLARPEVHEAVGSASAVLVQVFSGRMDAEWFGLLTEQIRAAIPHAVVAGVSSGGEIAEGSVLIGATVLSLLCFSATNLHHVLLECHHGAEYPTAEAIGRAFSELKDLRGILLFAPPASLDCARLLDGIQVQLPGVTLFGGGAGAEEAGGKSMVFGAEGIFEFGVFAVGFQSESLQIVTDLFFGWEALGPRMTLTDVVDNNILTIDNQPAFHVYSRYLSIDPGEELFLLEFPLLVERDGNTLARNPISCDTRGAVAMVADVYSGETARLGYLDIDTVMEDTRGTFAALQAFQPEAILLYSCVCRRFFLQQETELETLPFQQLAPVAGFFTYGEFIRLGGKLQLLNSSQVVVALRENQKPASNDVRKMQAYSDNDHFRMRHIRVTSRLFQFISTLTEEVEEASRMLQHEAEHDALTGAYNRHRLEGDLQEELSRAKRHDHPLSLVMFDIDHFKRINDEFGHITGDYVLKAVARMVWGILRKHDAMFRYGGEEFLLLLPETDLQGALAVAEKARAAIEELALTYNGKELPKVTVSFGVATAPQHGKIGSELVEAVDAALYRAKQGGRNRVEQAEM